MSTVTATMLPANTPSAASAVGLNSNSRSFVVKPQQQQQQRRQQQQQLLQEDWIHHDSPSNDMSLNTASMTSSTGSASEDRTNASNSSVLFQGIQKAASGTFENLKGWASPKQPFSFEYCDDEDNSIQAIKGRTGHNNSKHSGSNNAASRQQQLRLHLQRQQQREEERSGSCYPASILIRDLISPFVACGIVDHSSFVSKKSSKFRSGPLLDSFREDAASSSAVAGTASAAMSYDSATEEELLQLRRLTSWATINTAETDDASHVNGGSVLSNESSSCAIDDDGNIIHPKLLESAQKRRWRRRQKLVRFEYPPISRLRECPRPDPRDLPDLFFTEEELDEIEADRKSTISVDDVEIVAVAEDITQGEKRARRVMQRRAFASYQSTPKLAKQQQQQQNNDSSNNNSNRMDKRRASSPHPRALMRNGPDVAEEEGDETFSSRSQDQQSDSASSAVSSQSTSRLIKGVQIYLRERSTGRGGPSR